MLMQNFLVPKIRSVAFLVIVSSVVLSVFDADLKAFAQDKAGQRAFNPYIEGALELEAQSDNLYKSDDKTAEISDTYGTAELAVTAHLAPYFRVIGTFVVEPVLDPTDDRVFEDNGGYAEEIYASFTFNQIGINAGKYNPAFGIASDAAPGLYGDDFAGDYELTERLGVAVTYEKSLTQFGDLNLMASLYKLDNTDLSRSVFTERGKTSVDDGGASNTEGLESFALDAKFSNIMKSGIGFNVGFRQQAKGTGDVDDEQGFVAGVNGAYEFENAKLEWMVEGARLNNFNAGATDVEIITAGMQVTLLERYTLAVTGANRKVDNPAADEYTDRMLQISAGMEIYEGWSVDIAHKWDRTDSTDNRTFGILFAKAFEFNSANK